MNMVFGKMGGGQSVALKAVLFVLFYTVSVEAGPVDADRYQLGGNLHPSKSCCHNCVYMLHCIWHYIMHVEHAVSTQEQLEKQEIVWLALSAV